MIKYLDQKLGNEGTIAFVFEPSQIGNEITYLVDFGENPAKNRISLFLSYENGAVIVNLRAINKVGDVISGSKELIPFLLATKYSFIFTWSSLEKRIVFYLNGKEYFSLQNENLEFDDLGKIVFFGQDMEGKFISPIAHKEIKI